MAALHIPPVIQAKIMEEENKVVEPEVDQESAPELEKEEKAEELVEEPDEPEEPKVPVPKPKDVGLEDENWKQVAARAKKVEAKAKALESQLKIARGTLDVEDYIDISAALEGLDQREQTFIAEQHRLTGKPLSELRKSEDFSLWQSAYRAKVEKEKQALKPSGTQSESTKELPLHLKLKNASLEEKEKILTEAGLYKQPKRHEGPTIGGAQFNAR